MYKAKFIPPNHYESHEFQFQLVVEVLPIELEGSAWALSLEEQVELVVLDVLPWELAEACPQFEKLVILIPVPVGEQFESSVSWDEL